MEIPMKNPPGIKPVLYLENVAKLFSCLLVLAVMRPVAEAATITVTDTGDTIAVDGLVTLREAITSANNNADVNADVVAVGAYGTDTINFNITGAGVHTIAPLSRSADDHRSDHHRWLHAAWERGEYTGRRR